MDRHTTIRLIYPCRSGNVSYLLLGHACSCVLILLFTLAEFGCGNFLGQDAEVIDGNERLAAQVKVALAQDSLLNAAPIDVKANNGVVTLGGFVEDESQREQARKAARSVAGVQSVVNKITIK